MFYNPLLAIDFYKVDHRRQYPEGTTEIYSNLTPRYVKPCHGLMNDFDNQVVVFGIQKFIRELHYNWHVNFFIRRKFDIIQEYRQIVCDALGLDNFDCSHLEALRDLGYLPIRIKSIEEGYRVPIGVPVLTIVNTHPDFFWLTNYLETIISASLWKPMTCATIAFEFKRLLKRYADLTGVDEEFTKFQAHDFSFRGMSGLNDAISCGSAHLTSFYGTDCVPAIASLNAHYDAENCGELVGASVPATEHSVMTITGVDGEFEAIKRLITEVYPTGIVSIVADSYNLWTVLTEYLPKLKDVINERDGKVVIRPDSGDPIDIICGDLDYKYSTNEGKGALQLLWELFGGSTNEAGYKLLNPHIGLIYGDAITVDRADRILDMMRRERFASSNIVFGVGSYTYQMVTRDTFGFAMKATSAVVNGERRAIFKDPITGDGGKKSAKGLLHVASVLAEPIDKNHPKFHLIDDCSEVFEQNGFLKTVYEDGEMVNKTNLAKIRFNLTQELDHLIE